VRAPAGAYCVAEVTATAPKVWLALPWQVQAIVPAPLVTAAPFTSRQRPAL